MVDVTQPDSEAEERSPEPDLSGITSILESLEKCGDDPEQLQNMMSELAATSDTVRSNTMASGVIPAQQMLKKMQEAFGDERTPGMYDEAILGYVRAEHVREAMVLFVDMKRRQLKPSVDAYASLVEGFYLQFEVVSGDHMAKEMKAVYPSSVPPFLEVIVDDQEPRHSLDR